MEYRMRAGNAKGYNAAPECSKMRMLPLYAPSVAVAMSATNSQLLRESMTMQFTSTQTDGASPGAGGIVE